MKTIHVLIADDSRDFRQDLRLRLDREEGIQVVAETDRRSKRRWRRRGRWGMW